MSRVLPPRPNLEHLRSQAKDLLRDWQQRKPDAQLADAQHAIALEYGFQSWPKLKAHVESVIADDPRPGAASASDNPFLGTWIANLDASKRHPANPFMAATLAFAIDGDTVTITHTGRDAEGRHEQSTNTIQVDGREHPASGGGYVLIARWHGARVLETVARKDGQVVGGGSYEVSASGKIMTVSTRRPGANADGWSTDHEQVIVFDRASS
jgi:hypothetical protein